MSKPEKVALFFTTLFLPTQLGRHFWPEESFIYSIRVDYLSPTVYFWDILTVILLVVWLKNRPKLNQKTLLVLLFFLFTQVISLINAQNILSGIYRFEQFFVTGLFGVYISSKSLQDTRAVILKPLILGVLFEGILALAQFTLGKSIGFWILGERIFNLSTPSIANFNWYGQIFLRPYATFPHPNVLAAYLILVLPLIALLSKKINLLTMLIGSTAILLTFSRSAIALFFLESFFIFKKHTRILIVMLVVAAPLLILRFHSALNFDNLSLIRRGELTVIAVQAFLGSPIFGIGLNNFINTVSAENLIAGPSRFLQPVHNIFLLAITETGILGAVGFITLIFTAMAGLLRSKEQKILFFCWLSILFLGMFDHYFLTLPQGQRLFFLIWGMSFLRD